MEPKKILIVDDEKLVIYGIKEQLKDIPYVIESSMNAEEALTLLKNNPRHYALVLVDRLMFGMDGMALLKAMKADEQLKKIPFIMQTGEAEQEELDAAVEAGADKVILKTGHRDILIDAMSQFLDGIGIEATAKAKSA